MELIIILLKVQLVSGLAGMLIVSPAMARWSEDESWSLGLLAFAMLVQLVVFLLTPAPINLMLATRLKDII